MQNPYHHAIVHTLKRPWTTVHCNTGFTFESLPDLCHIHLVYLGEHLYGELRPLPMSSEPLVTPYALQAPTKKTKKSPRKVVDLSQKEATASQDEIHTDDLVNIETSSMDGDCSNQSGLPDPFVSSDPNIENSESLPDTIQSDMHTKETETELVSSASTEVTVLHTQKSFEYSYGPCNPRNLRSLATSALSKHFPGLDPLDVAILVASIEPKCDKIKATSPSTLAHLCRESLNIEFLELDIDL